MAAAGVRWARVCRRSRLRLRKLTQSVTDGGLSGPAGRLPGLWGRREQQLEGHGSAHAVRPRT